MRAYLVVEDYVVDKYLKDGWSLYGSPIVVDDTEPEDNIKIWKFFQAIVKYEEHKTKRNEVIKP